MKRKLDRVLEANQNLAFQLQ